MLYKIISLDYRYNTFEITRFRIDFATKYSYSFGGYIFLLTKNPLTKACIFLRRGSVSFIISFRVALSLYFYLLSLVISSCLFGCILVAFIKERF